MSNATMFLVYLAGFAVIWGASIVLARFQETEDKADDLRVSGFILALTWLVSVPAYIAFWAAPYLVAGIIWVGKNVGRQVKV